MRLFKFLAQKIRLARFERATLCLEGRCSIQLSYRRILHALQPALLYYHENFFLQVIFYKKEDKSFYRLILFFICYSKLVELVNPTQNYALAPAVLVARVRRIKFCSKKRGLSTSYFSQTILCFARSRFFNNFFFYICRNLFVFLEFH